jgi:DNA-binding response OmpR family regulator
MDKVRYGADAKAATYPYGAQCDAGPAPGITCARRMVVPQEHTAAIFTQTETYCSELIDRFSRPHGTWRVIRCRDRLGMIRQLLHAPVDLLVVDVEAFPDVASLVEWRRLHCFEKLPVLLFNLTSETGHWLDVLGRTDDVVWGFSPDEICVRCRRLLERDDEDRGLAQLTLGKYTLERAGRNVTIEGKSIVLTSREFALAWILFSNAGATVKRDTMAEMVWGKGLSLAAHSLEQHIYRLRGKLFLTGLHGICLRSVYGVGYRIEEIRNRPMPDDSGISSPVSSSDMSIC